MKTKYPPNPRKVNRLQVTRTNYVMQSTTGCASISSRHQSRRDKTTLNTSKTPSTTSSTNTKQRNQRVKTRTNDPTKANPTGNLAETSASTPTRSAQAAPNATNSATPLKTASVTSLATDAGRKATFKRTAGKRQELTTSPSLSKLTPRSKTRSMPYRRQQTKH